MPYTLHTSFADFYKEVNLPGDHRTTANTRREWLERALKGKLGVRETYAFGSIPRFTALEGHADVDVMVVLWDFELDGRKPSAVLKRVRDALADYSTSTRRNGQAVTLKFKSWPNVDIVPARRVCDPDTHEFLHYEIPNMHLEKWITSSPKSHASIINERARACGSHFRQLITIMKHWNRVKNAGRLQSFHIEAIAADAFNSAMSDHSWDVLRFLQAAQTRISFHWYDGADVSAYIDFTTRPKIQDAIDDAVVRARSAWAAGYNDPDSHEEAIRLWRAFFGRSFPNYG